MDVTHLRLRQPNVWETTKSAPNEVETRPYFLPYFISLQHMRNFGFWIDITVDISLSKKQIPQIKFITENLKLWHCPDETGTLL